MSMNIYTMSLSKTWLVILGVTIALAFPLTSVYAQNDGFNNTFEGSEVNGKQQVVPNCKTDANPSGMCGYCDLVKLASNIINFLIFFAIIVGVMMIVYSGFLFLTGGANPTQVTKAKNVLIAAFIGLVITLGAYLIISLVMSNFLKTDIFKWDTLPGCEAVGG